MQSRHYIPRYTLKRNEDIQPQKKDLHKNIYRTFIHNSLKPETLQMATSWRRDKQTVVNSFNVILKRNELLKELYTTHYVRGRSQTQKSTYCIVPLIWSSRTDRNQFMVTKVSIGVPWVGIGWKGA